MLMLWRNRELRLGAFLGAAAMLVVLAAAGSGYWMGLAQRRSPMLLDLNQVATAASGTNMAVATGAVSDEAEGVFFLDYLTGDLQCLVYYPRSGAFGARFYTNVQQHIPTTGKNAQYLMVTGSAITSRTSSNLKPANCLVYVTDVHSGMFAAYTVPWSKTAESSSQAQLGALVCVGGGSIRNYQINDQPKKPAGAPGAGGKNPIAAGNNANNLNNNLNNNNANNNNGNDKADPNAVDDPNNPNDPANAPAAARPPVKRKK